MNRTLAGHVLSTDDLAAIALDHGLTTAAGLESMAAARHNAARFHSDLRDLTREARYAMWGAGRLTLSTGPEPLTYQVRVVTTGMGEAGTPQFEHLVDVEATDPDDALLLATQLAASRADLVAGADRLMPLAAEILTDSTLDAF